MSGSGSPASADPGSSSHDNDGWMERADDVNGWEHFMFSDHGWPRVTETAETETAAKGELLYIKCTESLDCDPPEGSWNDLIV